MQLETSAGRLHVNELEQIIVRKIDAARERGLTVTLAIRELADEIGKSDSSLWVIWNNHQRRRKLMEEAMRKLMEEAERH
jgi:Flp pilus assembly protein CpaB